MTTLKPDGSWHLWALIFVAAGLVVVQFGALVVFSIENRSLKNMLEARVVEDRQISGRAERLLSQLNEMGWQADQ